MLNKNANCYNIEKNFKYNTVIKTFSKHITIFRTLSIDIWQLKCQQGQANKPKKISKLFFCKFFRIITFFFPILLRKATLESKSKAFLLQTSKTCSNVELFSIFSQTFLELIFATKMKTMLLEQSAVLFTSCQKKYCVYYVSEHLKYFTQINEYWLNKNLCLNIVLQDRMTI